ncbi:MAG: S8 family serine peptidase, partial [Thermoplasmata archaeon]
MIGASSYEWGKKLGRIPRPLIPYLFALLILLGSASPLLHHGRGDRDYPLVEDSLDGGLARYGEYIFGPISGERYLILKDVSADRVSYVGRDKVFHDLASLMDYELSLAEDSTYKLSPDLVSLLAEEGFQNDIVSVIIEMREQFSHEISLRVREKHNPSLQNLIDQRDKIYQMAKSRKNAETSLLPRPLEIYLTPSEVSKLEEINLEIDRKMHEIRKEIMDLTAQQNSLSQESLVGELISRSFHIGYQGHLLNTLSARVPVWYLKDLADRQDVAFVHSDFKMFPLLDHSADAILASAMWNSGITGGPWDLSVADTGINKTHPNLHVEWEKVVHDNGKFDPRYVDNPSSTDDFHGHGTHIAGIVESDHATYKGVAYGMRDMINAKFGYDTDDGLGGGDWGDCMKVIDWAIQTAGADVISFSFGGPGFTNGNSGPARYMDAVIDDLGVPIAIAAGNEGMGGVTIPGDSFNALTVGSMNDKNTDGRSDDTISLFSSRGPLDDGRIKPDVVAPGDAIRSANTKWAGANPDFVDMLGTSMAAPHVAASLLLMMNYTNDSSLFPAVYKAIMINQADEWGLPGPDNATGWGYIDLNDTLNFMDYHIEGFVNSTLRYRFYRGSINVDDKATLVWQRHANYIGASFPFQYWAPNDLDLYLYEMPSRNYLQKSDFSLSNVEQLSFSSAFSDVLLKVRVFGTIQGTTDEPFSLALMGNFNEVLPPSYKVDLSAPTDVLFGDSFFVFANVTNIGDLEGWNVNAALNLPPGLTLMSGSNPSSLGNLAKGATAMVSWKVRADAVGPQAISVDGFSSSLGENFINNSGPHIVRVQDVELPLIQDVRALPSPQEVYEKVNISAVVLDNTGVDIVRVDITKPDLTQYGNFTMAYHNTALRYYYLDGYPDLGDYQFIIWAKDINNNWNSSMGSFTIQDTTPPGFRNPIATPSPQEVYGSVNITVEVRDNFLLSGVWVELTYPDSSSYNYSMTNSFVDTYYYSSNYDIIGTYTFVVWAVDSEGNWNSTTGQFIVQDTTEPIANAGIDQIGVLIGQPVTFDGSLSVDNYGISSYVWTFLDGSPKVLTGVSPQYIFYNASCYDVTLNVTDMAGNYDTDTMLVCTIERNPPNIENVSAT